MQDLHIKVFQNTEEAAPFYVISTGIAIKKRGEITLKSGILNQFSGFSWILSGTLEFYEGPNRILAGPNYFHYNAYGESIWYRTVSDECTFRWLCFNGPLADAILHSYHYPKIQLSQHPYPAELFDRLESLSGNTPLEVRTRAAIVMEILARAGGTEYGIENRNVIKNAVYLIRHNLSNTDLGIEFLCERLKISPTTLTRIFREELQISPGRYLLNQRLLQGMSLLSGSDLDIGTISEKCGFRDPKTFSRFIRRSTGLSAREYRKQERLKQSETKKTIPVDPKTDHPFSGK